MRSTFQEVADKLNIPLIYANPNLANIKLDDLSHSDFSEEGLVLIVSPLYTSGVPYDSFGRISRPFEIGVFGILNLDFNDEDADALLTKCEKVFLSIVKILNLQINTVNVVPLRFDVGIGGMYANIFFTNKNTCDTFDMKPKIDDTVTEASQNAVKSSGIWTWVKGLFTPKDPTETEADTLTDESVFQFWKGELKKITWANIKAALRTYFDTIYSTFSGSYKDLSDKPTIPSNAAQITVSDQVTHDYTPAVQGDNLQQVTNKVAGLQGLTYRKLYEIELTDPIAFIDITKDLDGNDLDLRVGFKVSYYLLADVNSLHISGIQINGITDDVYEFSSLGRNYLICYGARFGLSGGISLNINGKNPDVLLYYRGERGETQPGTIVGVTSSQRIRQNIQSVTSFRLLTDGYLAGSKIVIYGA